MNLLLFGAPGAGKGAQSNLLIPHYKLNHISTGDLFRKALREQSRLGQQAKDFMDKGQLVPDSLVLNLIEQALHHRTLSKKGFILDGFPRTYPQATALNTLLKNRNLTLHKVLYLDVPQKDLIERLTGRRIAIKSKQVYHIHFSPPKVPNICDLSGEKLVQRKDDTHKVVLKRLQVYQKQTAPLLDYYRSQKILVTINGTGTKAEVFTRIQLALAPCSP